MGVIMYNNPAIHFLAILELVGPLVPLLLVVLCLFHFFVNGFPYLIGTKKFSDRVLQCITNITYYIEVMWYSYYMLCPDSGVVLT